MRFASRFRVAREQQAALLDRYRGILESDRFGQPRPVLNAPARMAALSLAIGNDRHAYALARLSHVLDPPLSLRLPAVSLKGGIFTSVLSGVFALFDMARGHQASFRNIGLGILGGSLLFFALEPLFYLLERKKFLQSLEHAGRLIEVNLGRELPPLTSAARAELIRLGLIPK